MLRAGSAIIGASSCVLMIVGALGPWVETPVGSLSAVEGFGWPAIVGASLALIVQIGTAAGVIRWFSLSATVIGLLGLAVWAIVTLGVRLARHSPGLLAAIVGNRARVLHLSAVGSIDSGWGIRLFGLASFILVLSSFAAAIFGATYSPTPRLRVRGPFRRGAAEGARGSDVVTASQGLGGRSDDLL